MDETVNTPFSFVYDSFLAKVTDDMYMELTEEETFRILKELLLNAIPKFEFPRVNLVIKPENIEREEFDANLTYEEINILSTYMIVEWLGQQLASVNNTRMQYAGSDFKFTSQANHMHKILQLKKDYEREGFHLQRLYSRRKVDENGRVTSTFGSIMSSSTGGIKDGIEV